MSLCIMQLLVRQAFYIMGYDNRIENGSHDCRGVYQSTGFEGEPTELGQSHPQQPERGLKRHKGSSVAGASGAPSRGPDILKLQI
jgi:hypothetical protein